MRGLERIWIVAERIASPFVNQLVVEADGAVSEEALAAALAKVDPVWPGARLVPRGRLRRTRWVTEGPAPAVRSVDGSGWDGRSGVGAPFLQQVLPPLEGPVAELLRVTGHPGGADWRPGQRLVFRTHHAVMDGRATWAWAADIARALRGEEPRGAQAGPLTDAGLAERIIADSGDDRRLPEPPPIRVAPTGALDPKAPPQQVWARRRVSLRPRRLLLRLMVALQRASRAHTDGPLNVAVPVDLRRHLEEGEAVQAANLTGILRLDLPRIMLDDRPDEDGVSEALLDSLSAALKTALSGHDAARQVLEGDRARGLPLWLMNWAAQKRTEARQKAGRYPVSATLSNLGVQPLAELASPGWTPRRAFWIPPGSPGLPLFMALAGDEQGFEMCASAPARLASGGRLEQLLEEMARELERMQG